MTAVGEQTTVIYEKLEAGGGTESKSQRAGVTLEWSNIQLKVGSGDNEKTLLHTMAGFARPQQMLAVMGSSGAGYLHHLTALILYFIIILSTQFEKVNQPYLTYWLEDWKLQVLKEL